MNGKKERHNCVSPFSLFSSERPEAFTLWFFLFGGGCWGSACLSFGQTLNILDGVFIPLFSGQPEVVKGLFQVNVGTIAFFIAEGQIILGPAEALIRREMIPFDGFLLILSHSGAGIQAPGQVTGAYHTAGFGGAPVEADGFCQILFHAAAAFIAPAQPRLHRARGLSCSAASRYQWMALAQSCSTPRPDS